MQLSVENLNQADNKKWKKVADYFLYTALPSINVFLAAVQPVSPEFTIYAMAISNLLIALFKGLSKFTSEENVSQN
jgi:hypothetical protein